MTDIGVAFAVRRARLPLGMTRSEFAALYGTGEGFRFHLVRFQDVPFGQPSYIGRQ